MKIVIDIPDETFEDHIRPQERAARYLRIVASQLVDSGENSGIAPLTPAHLGIAVHSAGWAVEGAPWQKSSLDIEENV